MINKSYNLEEIEMLKDSVKDIIEDYKAGVPMVIIGSKYECSLPTLYTILHQNGVKLSGKNAKR